jgi:hypothetical protein
MMLATLILLACEVKVPASLPPPIYVAPATHGRMVQHGQVTGYLTMQRNQAKANGEGIITLVETIDDEAREILDRSAQAGAAVLAIEPHVDVAAAISYVRDFSGIEKVTVDCLRSKQSKNATANTDHLSSCPYHR